MARRKRWWVDYGIYHITYRCHEREFLFKFAKHRDLYVRYLRDASRRYRIDILNYMVTSNHIHLLISAKDASVISEGLQYLHSRVAQKYNFLKQREGAFWKDRFHATRIQDGEYFGRCMFYIDMNMVRAGVVKHPAGWEHCAYHEFIGERQRYRVVNMKRLLRVLGMNDEESFRAWYIKTLETKLAGILNAREIYWSKAVAVGSEAWLNSVAVENQLKRYKIEAENGVNFIRGRK